MKLIPYEKFQIDTGLSSEELVQRIRAFTGEKKLFSFSPTHEFSGHVNEYEFEITKNITYQNSFNPVIEGKIEQKSVGAQVTISMRLNLPTMIFMFIWFLVVGIGCMAFLSNMNEFSLQMLIPFGMLIFGVALVSGGFWFEASKQKRRLIELLSKK
ncbi:MULTISPECIES: hypothetical protein [Pseudoalteromonas]|uniref:Uncharacterized protein n=2 Tax=Pseudoalteromonas TaxID=53246 RepID=A0A4Q7E3J1_9GAMM|nr:MULTISPECIES: hypothetical protein [Pseudoalteromonas]QTL34361.1 hypothetical protein J5X90_12420 [Pseudoalteromonas viridis]RZM76480.1 hypothetical protein C3B51_18105 [Pseudoalteromonas rubra]